MLGRAFGVYGQIIDPKKGGNQMNNQELLMREPALALLMGAAVQSQGPNVGFGDDYGYGFSAFDPTMNVGFGWGNTTVGVTIPVDPLSRGVLVIMTSTCISNSINSRIFRRHLRRHLRRIMMTTQLVSV